MNQAKQTDYFWADLIRVVVIFSVVLVHVAADVITEWGVFPKSWWWSAHVYDSLVRGGVPVFVMLSGAFLLPKTETYREFFAKRFNRIAIPSIAWIILYLIWKKHFYKPDLGLVEALRWVLGNQVHFHLWFLYLIVGLYLVTPVFRIFIAHAKKGDLIYFLLLWFAISSFIPFLEGLGELLHFNLHLKIPVEPATGFIGYFILGHFLTQYVSGKSILTAFAIWCFSLLVCLFGTYFLSVRFHLLQMIFYGNMAPNVVLYTGSFFVLARFLGTACEHSINPIFKNLISVFSKASFGIYLVHPMIIDALRVGRWGFVLKGDMPHPVYMIPLTTLAIYICSFAAIFIIQKIPYLRKIV